MIQANELRIGNWVAIPECAIHAQIIGVWNDSIMIDIEPVDLDPEQSTFELTSLEPILLTPEILEKWQFKKYGEWLQLNKFSLYPLVINISCVHNKTTIGANEEYDFPYHIEYLHQLQNLYFALTFEELELAQ